MGRGRPAKAQVPPAYRFISFKLGEGEKVLNAEPARPSVADETVADGSGAGVLEDSDSGNDSEGSAHASVEKDTTQQTLEEVLEPVSNLEQLSE